MSRRALTIEEQRAADKLKAVFKEAKAKNGSTYEAAANSLGWSAGNLSQYLNGHIPLNIEALLKICSIIPDANAFDIYPELFKGIETNFCSDPKGITKLFYSLDEEMQNAIMKIIQLSADR